MIPMVSAALTMARAIRGLSIPDVAAMAGVEVDDVFDAENFLEDTDPVCVHLIAMTLHVDLRKLDTGRPSQGICTTVSLARSSYYSNSVKMVSYTKYSTEIWQDKLDNSWSGGILQRRFSRENG